MEGKKNWWKLFSEQTAGKKCGFVSSSEVFFAISISCRKGLLSMLLNKIEVLHDSQYSSVFEFSVNYCRLLKNCLWQNQF